MNGRLQRFLLAAVFFLACLSLGYPTLNRYDVRSAEPDSRDYAAMVDSGQRAARFVYSARVLVPYLARPFAGLARGRVGSWDPTSFGLLVANSMLTAGAAYILFTIAFRLTGSSQTALVAGLLYLLNFEVSNQMLAGMVDSGEAFFLIAATALLLRESWRWLPVVAVFGATSKETFVPFLTAFAAVWALAGSQRRTALLWTTVSVALGLATTTALFSIREEHLVWPWGFAAGLASDGDHLRSAVACLTNRAFWYVFVWLLPLGLWKIRTLPRPWVLGCASASIVAIAFSAYHNSPAAAGAAARPLFSIAGPLLSLSAALVLCSSEAPQQVEL